MLSCVFDKTRKKQTNPVQILINSVKVDTLDIKGGYFLKPNKRNQKDMDKHADKSLKKGDKKLNGPNRPAT